MSAESAEEGDYRPGQRVPGTVYDVVRVKGAGGMGTVYEVEDTTVSKRYMLKTLKSDHRERRDLIGRLLKEARHVARLQHTNIVQVFTAGETADELRLPYYVMEKLHGQTLHEVLNTKGSLDVVHAVSIASDLLDALAYAHDENVLHRDVKPANIFLHRDPKGRTVTKLIDFGILKLLDGSDATAGRYLGTYRYSSPEQLRVETVVPQSDLYAAGLVLYEMLAGRGPFDHKGKLENQVAMGHLNDAPPSLRSLGVVAPPGVEAIVMQALEKDFKKRPRSAWDFLKALRVELASLRAQKGEAHSAVVTVVPLVAPVDPAAPPSARAPNAVIVAPSGMAPPTGGEDAATEHAATRAGTPVAKSAGATPRPSAPPAAPAAASQGATMMGMTAPPVSGPTAPGAGSLAGEPPHVLQRGSIDVATEDPQTGTKRRPVDRRAPTHSANVSAPGEAKPEGTTERLPVVVAAALARESRNEPNEHVTVRMSGAPPRPADVEASELLARLPANPPVVPSTDGSVSSTLTPRLATKMRPLIAIAIGLALTIASVTTVWLIAHQIRRRIAGAEEQSVAAASRSNEAAASQPDPAAASAPVAASASAATAVPVAATVPVATAVAGPPVASVPPAVPTIAPPLDIPEPAASPAPAPVPRSRAVPRSNPVATATPASPPPPRPAPPSPPILRRPSSGL